MSGISERNPFVGPRPIQQGEALHGRGTELRELYNLLQARRIVVLHSPSGAGKSSLVQAGLIPRLRAGNFDVWRTIRVNLDPAGLAGVPAATNRYLLSAMLSLEEELPAAQRRSPAQLAGLEFAAYLASRPRRKGQDGRPIVLLFDQFEEVLTVAPWAVAEKQAFFTAVGAALDSQSIWALFLIREDFLAAFAPYRDRIPTQMANTFRLDLLGRAGAREAAVELARAGGRSFPAVDQLIHDLSTVQVQQPDGSFVAEQGPYVEPVHLQVVGRRLWAAMPEDDLSIEAKDIAQYASVSTALADYYAQAVKKIAGGDIAVERALREWVGGRLIVGGIRSQVRQEAGRSAGLDNALIEPLLASYLVRSEQRAGANWFELSHDRLVEPVLLDNKAWEAANLHPLQVQAQLWESGRRAPAQLLSAQALPGATAWAQENAALLTEGEREFLEQSRKLRAEEARRRRLQKVYMLILALGAVAGLTLGSYALHQRGLAEEQMARAERLREDAIAARERAREAAWMGYVRTFATRDPTRALLGLVEIKSTDTVPGWLQEAQDALQQPSTRTLLRGHAGSVVDAALSPDGTRVVTASTDGTARVWQVDGGGVPVVLRGHRGPVHSAAFSRDGTRIVTASADGTARVWRADGSGTSVELPGPTEQADVGDYRHIRSASFSGDGERVLLLPVADGVRIWDAEGRGAPVDLRLRGRFAALRNGYGNMAAASFSEDGTRVLTTEPAGRAAWVWRADGSGDPVALAVKSEASRVDGAQVIVPLDGPIRVVGPWNTAEEVWRRSVVELKDSAGMWDARFIDDGARVVGYDRVGGAWVWRADGRGGRQPGPPPDTDLDSEVGDSMYDNGVPGPVFRPNPGWSGKALAEESTGALVPAFAAAFSSDGRRVATVADGRARLWDADGSGAPITLHREGVLSIAWSADGERVLTLARDSEGRRVFDVWNTQAGQQEPVGADLERHGGVVSSAWASPEGRRAWSFSAELGAARGVQIWGQDGDHARLVAELRGHADIVLAASFGADGQRMVTGSRDGTARVWNVGGPAFAGETLQHSSPVQWASFSGDGGRIATVTYDHTVRVWDGDGRGAPREMPIAADAYGREWILVASISPDGKRVATGYYGPALLWEVDSGAVRRLEPVGEAAKPAGEAAQPAGEAAQPAGEAAQPVGEAAQPVGFLWASLSPDGQRIVAAADDRRLMMWGGDGSGGVALPGQTGVVLTASFSPDGRRLVTGCVDGMSRVWPLDGGAPIELRGHSAAVRAAAFSPDGARVVTASDDKTARVWTPASGASVVLTGHEDNVYTAAFSPDGRYVLTASEDGSAGVWQADGSGARVAKLAAYREPVAWAAWSPDSRFVVTASGGGKAMIWPADGSGAPVELKGHRGPVHWAEYSPDGKRVLTASQDTTARLWTVDAAELKGLMRAVTTLCVSAEDRVQYLGDTPAEACEAFAACEQRHGRQAGDAGLGWSVCRSPGTAGSEDMRRGG